MAYTTWAAAVLPSMVFIFLPIELLLNILK
jgi:hypothetical protein